MIARHRLDYRTGFSTPKCPQSRKITSRTPITGLRARDARDTRDTPMRAHNILA